MTALGLKAALGTNPDMQFLAATQSLAEGVDMVNVHAPDVLILDKAFGLDAVLETVKRLRESGSPVFTVVWGTSISEAEALRILQAGARGIARKTVEAETLLSCLVSVAAGGTWMEDSVFRESARADRYPRSQLTARERQVMGLVEQGLKNKEIGRELGIRPGTVKIHLKHIFEKTGVKGRYGLALSGLKDRGLISLNHTQGLDASHNI